VVRGHVLKVNSTELIDLAETKILRNACIARNATLTQATQRTQRKDRKTANAST